MSIQEKQFLRELEIFRTEAQTAAQFLYAYLTFNSILVQKRKTLNIINHAPLFWNTVRGSLQTSFFIVLGRIFDQTSPHNVDILLKCTQDNIGVFSKEALYQRKRLIFNNDNKGLDKYLKTAYAPTAKDFRNLRKKIKSFRRKYESNYQNIRHKIFAHKEESDSEEVQKLFSKTNTRELQQIIVFVNALYNALWELFNNGRKPILRRMRYSVKKMMQCQRPAWEIQTVQERMVAEVKAVLKELTRNFIRSTERKSARKRIILPL